MKWIEWGRKLQAISQSGLHFTQDRYDRERYEQIGEIAAVILAEHTNLSVEELLKLNIAEFGYATPKVDVRGVVFKDEKILLVREIADGGKWTLPGGWADINETPTQAVTREVQEESGFETRVIKLLAVYDREKQKHTPPFP
jgi:8-oxo-dGTP pyrophosphatase MutT (NUDIX family)